MNDQKLENLLNLSLEATPEERQKSPALEVGYDPSSRSFELIVKYHGNLTEILSGIETISVVELMNNYAILHVPEFYIDALVQLPEIEYVEKPKRLFFAVNRGRTASCISTLQVGDSPLLGSGVLIAVIDSGVDYRHLDFRNPDGSSRILNLWDQTINTGPAPQGYNLGTVYTKAQIDEALLAPTRAEGYAIVPSQDRSGHGTNVLGIAAGNGRSQGGRYRGVAPESNLIVVKLGTTDPEGFPRTTQLMQAVNYVVEQARAYGQPVAVNISFGNTYGAHNGTSLLETYLDSMSDVWKSVFVIGSGNEGASGNHTSGQLVMGQSEVIEFSIGPYERSLSIQIWKDYVDQVDIQLRSPSGRRAGPIQDILGAQRFRLGTTEILLYYGEPAPYSLSQEIFIEFIPGDTYLESGVWTILLIPRTIKEGTYNLWMPSAGVLSPQTRFYNPTPNLTITIPSTAAKVLTVGAYDALRDAYADFSGRGYISRTQIKPDLVAPGVDITTTAVGGGYTTVSGTSFATPFVSGSAALMMEWGIVRDNDPFLYGEKVKAYLRKGARQLPGYDMWPNPMLGYGVLCVRDSLPV